MVVRAPESMAGRDPHELLATEPLVRYDRNAWGGRQADEYLRANGIVPRERFELNALNAIAVMVDRGLGVSLVPAGRPAHRAHSAADAERAAAHRHRVVALQRARAPGRRAAAGMPQGGDAGLTCGVRSAMLRCTSYKT